MIVFRYILLGFSALAALILMMVWIFSGRAFDLVLFIALAFLIANAVYIFSSRPVVRTSDILARASTGFALASLELQHHAQEAQIREVEAEKRRLAEAEYNRQKLHVAKEMLQHLRPKLLLERREAAERPQITHQTRSEPVAPPKPPSGPDTADNVRLSHGRDAVEKPVPPTAQMGTMPSPIVVN
ncbi:hypothetical protein MKK88_01790 [Methylobacterium sp. E-005]|uniref:hypothetical protein n=1 Tax=Methylobacterium sp. E-005 TaxID=2836549 RepID=UPI001FBB97C5|nr:hypothetical protein [Methylobacterium sp. E-005]MCJ2084726.1 hypothetical protein [Methylobacterium sp. E-005]